jgi:hypothetical protein
MVSPAIYGVVLKTFVRIEVDGREVVYHHGCSVSFSFEQSVAEAEFEVPWNYPSWLVKWAPVKIIIGATYSSAKPRFSGYVLSMEAKLWEPGMTVKCKGILVKAIYGFPPTSIGVNLGEGTDQAIIQMCLEKCGIPTSMLSIEGLGKILGSDMDLGDFGDYIDPGMDLPDIPAGYIWGANQSGMSLIQSIEQVTLGYRTHDTPSGIVVRRRYSTIPYDTAKYEFKQGINILEGTMAFRVKEPVDQVTIIARDGTITTYPPTLDIDLGAPTQVITSPWIIDQLDGLTPVEVANWRLEQIGWTFIQVGFATHEDVDLRPGDTVYCESPWMRVNQNFYVQAVKHTVDDAGMYTQSITLVSELGLGNWNPGITAPIGPGTPPGTPGPAPAPTLPPPPEPEPIQDGQFTVKIMQEVLDDNSVIYDVQAESAYSDPTVLTDSSEATWAAEGPGCTVGEGSGPTFTTTFTSLEGASITLTEGGVSGTRQLDDGAGESINNIKKLYTCTDSQMLAFDGTEWRVQTPSGGEPVTCVGNGPFWGAGNRIYFSHDDLETEAIYTEAVPPGELVSAIWVVQEGFSSDMPALPGDPIPDPGSTPPLVLVGGNLGSLRASLDGGENWEDRFPQHNTEIEPIVPNVIRSIVTPKGNSSNVLVSSLNGWFMSVDGGVSFESEEDRAPGSAHQGFFIQSGVGVQRSIVVSKSSDLLPYSRVYWIQGQFEGVQPSTKTDFNFEGVPLEGVVGATSHIRQDKIYAVASDGRTFHQGTEPEASTTLVQGSSIPEGGIPAEGGVAADADFVDIVYVAADNGLWKSVDGFRTDEGWRKLKSPPA